MPAKKRSCDEPQSMSRKKRTLGDTAKGLMNPVAIALLLKWAWGALAATDLQEIAHAIKLSGNTDDDIDDLASLGAYGHQKGNIMKDLKNKFCQTMLVPLPFSVKVPYYDHTAPRGKSFHTEMSMFLPSQWLATLTNDLRLELQLDEIFGISKLESFWATQLKKNPKMLQHPMMKKNNFTKRAIPVLIHGDGAEFEYNNSLMTISMTGLLKEGSVADTSLLLASWPKNSTVKGVEDTWRVIWHWLSWDFNQLFDNRYHGQDPWKGPLPEDREELAGQAICGHDLFVVLWGVLGDHEFFQNHLGLPNTSNQAPNPACQWCLCNKLNMKNHWFNFDDAAPWMKGGPREAADHPINTIVGMTSGHYLVDWLHTVDLGIASHALANVLFNIVYDKLNHMSRAKAMELVVDKLLAYPSHHGSDFSSMELKHITNPQRPHK